MTSWQQRHILVPAVYVMIERDGKILFLRRFNTGYMDGDYTFPAGHLDGNEPPTVAAARESYEEAGVTVQPEDLHLVHCMVYKALEGDHERVSLFFKASTFSGEPRNMEPKKCDNMRWFSAKEFPEKMVWELRYALDQIKRGNHYSEANYEGN